MKPFKFTRREREIILLISRGIRSDKEIANSLHMARGTAKIHISHAMDKARGAGYTVAQRYDLPDVLSRLAASLSPLAKTPDSPSPGNISLPTATQLAGLSR